LLNSARWFVESGMLLERAQLLEMPSEAKRVTGGMAAQARVAATLVRFG
jgi:hypothetical protein